MPLPEINKDKEEGSIYQRFIRKVGRANTIELPADYSFQKP
jgi:hypothetical protein